MRRFYAAPENFSENQVTIRGAEGAHIRSVLRLKPGERVHVIDGLGNRYRVRLNQVNRKEVIGDIEFKETAPTESSLNLSMGVPLLKGAKLDEIVRKSVELGVQSLTPLQTERGIVQISPSTLENKLDRWNRISREASKQCNRVTSPKISEGLPGVEKFCRNHQNRDLKIIFWEEESDIRLNQLTPGKAPASLAFLTGPEGGFTAGEVETAKQFGFQPVGLGPRILRAETAPIAALAILQNLWGDI